MIELVVVIVLLGILSAAALPRFLDLRSDSELAAMQRLSSSLSSAAAMNLARCQITANVADGVKCIAVSNCTDVGGLLEGGLPAASQPGTSIYIVSQ
jgi:MSHA pilin protein MshA